MKLQHLLILISALVTPETKPLYQMKKVFLYFSLLLPFLTMSAQNGVFKWGTATGASGLELNTSICTDVNGNLYSTGGFSDSCDFDPGIGSTVLTCAGGNDVFVRKMTATGQFVWAKSFLGTGGYDRGYVIRSDANDGILVAGNFNGTVDFDPGSGQSLYTPQGLEDLFIVKLDTNGNFLWAKTIFSFARVVPRDLQVDMNGNIFITGQFNGTVDFDPGPGNHPLTSSSVADIFICKLDVSGNFIWAKNLEADANNNSAGSLALDAVGNPIVVGSFYGNIDLDPGTGTAMHASQGYSDICVVKLDANGNYLWGHTFGSMSTDYATSVIVDDQANSYITGAFSDIVDFDPGSGGVTCGTGGCRDIFLQKLDAAGNLVWVNSLNGHGSFDSGNDLCFDAQGDVILVGNFNGDIDLDPGPGTANFSPVDQRDFFVLKVNPMGNFLWAKAIGGQEDGLAVEVISGKGGELFLCGSFKGDIDLDPGANQANHTSAGDFDMFTVSLENILLVQNDAPLSERIWVYPNPNNGIFRIEWETKDAISFRLFSPDGRLVSSGTTSPAGSVDVSLGLAAGVYMLEIKAGEERELRKLWLR